MKRFLFVIWILALGFTAYAVDGVSGNVNISATGSSLPQMTGALSNGMSLGYVKVGTSEVALISWRPDWKIGPWVIGLDLNIPMGDKKPSDLETVVVRKLGYDDGQKGLIYGVIDNVTYGAGLLVKNYTTRVVGPVYLDNQQMGFQAYYNLERMGVNGLFTWSHVYALRLTEPINPMLIVGQTMVTDADGRALKQPDGTDKVYPSVTGYSVDAAAPLPYNFRGYAEYAMLADHGGGFTLGMDWGMDIMLAALSFNAGYRVLDKKFAPSYFNENYETNPIDLVSYEAISTNKNGWLIELKGIVADITRFRVAYEAYQGSNASLNADATAKYDPVTLSAYYSQPNFVDARSLDAEQGAIMGAAVGYKVNPYTTLVTNYKKAYNPTLGKVEDTQTYEVQLSF